MLQVLNLITDDTFLKDREKRNNLMNDCPKYMAAYIVANFHKSTIYKSLRG